MLGYNYTMEIQSMMAYGAQTHAQGITQAAAGAQEMALQGTAQDTGGNSARMDSAAMLTDPNMGNIVDVRV